MSEAKPPNEYLRDARKSAKFSQAKLGELLGRDQGWVSRIESGDYGVYVPDYVTWLEACGLASDIRPIVPGRQEKLRELRLAASELDDEMLMHLLSLAWAFHDLPARVVRGLMVIIGQEADQAPDDERRKA